MNLRSFHLVFIACSSALCCLIAAWALGSTALGGAGRLAVVSLASLAGLGLAAYGVWFARASRRMV